MIETVRRIARRVHRFMGTTEPGEGIWIPSPTMSPGINWHEAFIVHLAAIARPRVYLELGLGRCLLFNQVIPYAQRLVGVDINPAAQKLMYKSPKATFVCASTDEYAGILRDSPLQIDMLFIDADHSKESVLSDFVEFFPFVANHGLILMHDVHPGDIDDTDPSRCGTAFEAADQLSRAANGYEIVTIPVPPGLAVCRKRDTQLSWRSGTGS